MPELLGDYDSGLVAGDELDCEIMGVVSTHCSELFLGPGDGDLHQASYPVVIAAAALLQFRAEGAVWAAELRDHIVWSASVRKSPLSRPLGLG